jgi:hypothetical protein
MEFSAMTTEDGPCLLASISFTTLWGSGEIAETPAAGQIPDGLPGYPVRLTVGILTAGHGRDRNSNFVG